MLGFVLCEPKSYKGTTGVREKSSRQEENYVMPSSNLINASLATLDHEARLHLVGTWLLIGGEDVSGRNENMIIHSSHDVNNTATKLTQPLIIQKLITTLSLLSLILTLVVKLPFV